MKHIKPIGDWLAENLTQDEINEILDKISQYGIETLSNHEKRLLRSYSDSSIDAREEIDRHLNKYKASKEVVSSVGLAVSGHDLSKDIGRYVRKTDRVNNGLLGEYGIIFEIVGVQKHWGYVDGKYVPNKIGYRMARVGVDDDFGCVGDVDEIEFINDMTEEQAIEYNRGFDAWYKKRNRKRK